MTARASLSPLEAQRRVQAATGVEWARVDTFLRDHARDHGVEATLRRLNTAAQHLVAEMREEGLSVEGPIG